jgi:hypothetical protein
MEWGNQKMVEIYVAACNPSYNEIFWKNILFSTINEEVSLDAGTLISYGMALPISAREIPPLCVRGGGQGEG